MEFAVALAGAGVLDQAALELGSLAIGFGPFVELVSAILSVLGFDSVAGALRYRVPASSLHPLAVHLTAGTVLWVAGWAALSYALRSDAKIAAPKSDAAGRALHPKLGNYRDFHWGTLAAYGFGIFLAEAGFIVMYLLLVGKGSTSGAAVEGGLSPVWAFVWAFFLSMVVAGAGGFLGAANSRRLSTPEATMAILYFGTPIPTLLTLMHFFPAGMLRIAVPLREIAYLSSMLGENRPELGYWLVTAGLTLAFFLGINFGFVATSSGRLDLRASYELFVASRHVSVFRWKLLGGVFLVLIFGIVPPLIAWAIISAAEKAVERTRIRLLGLEDPLLAAEAINDLKVREETPTERMTWIAVGGVGVGVMALIIVLSVMSGFEADLQKKILGTNSHGVVMKYTPDMPEYEETLGKVNSVKGIIGATPFILNEVMVSSEGNISGAMIKGIDPKTVGSVTDLAEYLRLGAGSLDWLDDPSKIQARRLAPLGGPALDEGGRGGSGSRAAPLDGGEGEAPPAKPKGFVSDVERDPLIDMPAPDADADAEPVLPGVIVGRELAATLKVVVGDRLNVISPLGGELGPQGPMPKSRPFRVAGIFYSGMFEYDSKFVYINLRDARTFFNVKGASGIEVKVDDIDNARSTLHAVYEKLDGYPYRVKDWGEMNRNLFSALRLEKLVMGIILSMIVIVAAGLIVATVIMLVLEKRKEIAVLKALGVPDGGIVKIFLMEGLQIGVAGGVLGLVAGLAWCLFIEKVGIKLDPQVYYIPSLPVRIEPFQTALSVVVAVLVTFLASIWPALTASQVEPVDGLKSE